jgi:thiosulfate dehydrogenase [quinone] large subunit
MSVQHGTHIAGEPRTPTRRQTTPVTTKAPDQVAAESVHSVVTSAAARRILAVLRFATGFIFLWAFLDKTFGLGFATTSERAWINGGSPTKGFLGSVDVGPFVSIAHSMAGTWWADWLFMLSMLGVGIAMMAGIAMWPAAIVGSVVVLMMWAAEFPLDRFATDGTPSGSPNPIVDYHIIYALALLALAATSAGATWGLSRYWNRLPYIRNHAWTR